MFGWIAAAIIGSAVVGAVSQPKPPKVPDAPKPKDALDVIDKVNGVQTVIVKGANGKYQKVTSRLPRSKEEEEVVQWASNLMGDTMQNLHRLYKTDPNASPSYEPLIKTFANLNEERIKDMAEVMGGDIPTQQKFIEEVNAFKEMQSNVLEDAFRRQENKLMEGLIQNGHLDSSAATEMRAQLAKNYATASAENNIEAERYGRALTDQQFARATSIYNMDRQQRMQDFNLKDQARVAQLEKEMMGYQMKGQEEDRDIRKAQSSLGLVDAVLSKDLSKAQTSQAPAMHMNGYQQQLAGHQAQMNATQQNFHNRMMTPNLGQTLGKLGVGLGGIAAGQYMSHLWPSPDSQSNTAAANGYMSDINGTNYKLRY